MQEAWFGLLGVVIGASIPVAIDWWKSRIFRLEEARYLGIRVVCVLDAYIEKCLSVVYDTGHPNADGYLETQIKTPDSPIFSDEINWKSINHDIAYEVLSFSNDIQSANQTIAFTADNADPPDYEEWFEERVFQYAKLGLKAHEMTTKLRKIYSIPQRVYDGYDPISELRQELRVIQDRRAKKMAQIEQLIAQSDAK